MRSSVRRSSGWKMTTAAIKPMVMTLLSTQVTVFQVEHDGQTVENQNQDDALDQLARAGFARELQQLVKDKGDNEDVQRIGQRVKCTQAA